MLTVLTNACSAFGWTLQHALHEVSVAEVFALNACHAWGQGMEPAGETYEDRDLISILGGP